MGGPDASNGAASLVAGNEASERYEASGAPFAASFVEASNVFDACCWEGVPPEATRPPPLPAAAAPPGVRAAPEPSVPPDPALFVEPADGAPPNEESDAPFGTGFFAWLQLAEKHPRTSAVRRRARMDPKDIEKLRFMSRRWEGYSFARSPGSRARIHARPLRESEVDSSRRRSTRLI
jgi:hypothetical protein